MAEAAPRNGEWRAREWLRVKLRMYAPGPRSKAARTLARKVARRGGARSEALFDNPFAIDDLSVFDDETLGDLLEPEALRMEADDLGRALRGGPRDLVERIAGQLEGERRAAFLAEARAEGAAGSPEAGVAAAARGRLLDGMFWELTYWRTPDLYEELTAGERIHPGIFLRLAGDLRGRVALDAGAGSGRATLACLRVGAAHVYAIEPSPGLTRILRRKLEAGGDDAARRVTALRGRFDTLPLPENSVDVALSCSAFTSEPDQGGEAGLAELRRVTRPGGKIVLIWPRPEDYAWLAERGFSYVSLPVPEEMGARYRSRRAALEVARRFYAGNRAVLRYVMRHREPAVPYAVLGANPPHDYCWMAVEK